MLPYNARLTSGSLIPQAGYIKSRKDVQLVVKELFDQHIDAIKSQKEETSSRKENVAPSNLISREGMNGEKESQKSYIPAIRKGVKPGSFLDLLVRGNVKGSGEDFSENAKHQQVSLLLNSLTLNMVTSQGFNLFYIGEFPLAVLTICEVEQETENIAGSFVKDETFTRPPAHKWGQGIVAKTSDYVKKSCNITPFVFVEEYITDTHVR